MSDDTLLFIHIWVMCWSAEGKLFPAEEEAVSLASMQSDQVGI